MNIGFFYPPPKERNSSSNFQPIHFLGVNSLLGAGNLHSVIFPTTWRIIPSGQSPPILSHLGHLKGKQPYLRDLLTMVINHLVTGMILQPFCHSKMSKSLAPPSNRHWNASESRGYGDQDQWTTVRILLSRPLAAGFFRIFFAWATKKNLGYFLDPHLLMSICWWDPSFEGNLGWWNIIHPGRLTWNLQSPI